MKKLKAFVKIVFFAILAPAVAYALMKIATAINPISQELTKDGFWLVVLLVWILYVAFFILLS